MIISFLTIIGIIIFIIGLLTIVYPVIPGLILMLIGAWITAYSWDYQVIGYTSLVVIGSIALLGTAIDYLSGVMGTNSTGASKYAIWGSLIGGILGIFVPFLGIFLGPIIGAAIGEYLHQKDLYKVGKVSIGTFIGIIIGAAIKVACALIILILIASRMIIYYMSN